MDPGIAVEAVVAMARWAYQSDATVGPDAADECARFVVNGLRAGPPTSEETQK
jgi:hypothetical protein